MPTTSHDCTLGWAELRPAVCFLAIYSFSADFLQQLCIQELSFNYYLLQFVLNFNGKISL